MSRVWSSGVIAMPLGLYTPRTTGIEALLSEDGKRPEDSTLDDLEALWQRAKAGE